jgi:CheY-like chemotaxis protein
MARKKIMVVEDETITLALTQRLLEQNGYDVVSTREGSNAVSLALAEQPDLILLDLSLGSPDPFGGASLDGFGVLDWLHRMMKEVDVPVIVVTGNTDPNIRERVLEAGAVAYIQKPVEKKRILTAIRIALESGEA